MAIEIFMPQFSDVMAAGTVVEWLVRPGQAVAAGQVIAEIETEKAIVELPSPAGGVLAARAAEAGQAVAVGGLLAVLAEPAEDVEQVARRFAEGAYVPRSPAPVPGAEGLCPPDDPRPAAPAEAEVIREVPLSGMRGAVARRTVWSVRQAPQYQVAVDCDAAGLLAVRKALRRDPGAGKVGLNALIFKCVAAALRRHGRLNAVIVEDVIYELSAVNIGMAVAVPDGVVLPVVRDVAARPVAEVHAELEALTLAARARLLREEQLRGGSFTISSLAGLGVHSFTAIVSPPQVAILAVGSIRHEPVLRDGGIVPGERIALTVTVDHRAVDGSVAGEFMMALKDLIEDPAAALV